MRLFNQFMNSMISFDPPVFPKAKPLFLRPSKNPSKGRVSSQHTGQLVKLKEM